MNNCYKVKKNRLGISVVTSEFAKNKSVLGIVSAITVSTILLNLLIGSYTVAQTLTPDTVQHDTATGQGNVALIDYDGSGKFISANNAMAIQAVGSLGAGTNIISNNATLELMTSGGLVAYGIRSEINNSSGSSATITANNNNIKGVGYQARGIVSVVKDNSVNITSDIEATNGSIMLATEDTDTVLDGNIGIYTEITGNSTGTIAINSSADIQVGHDAISSSGAISGGIRGVILNNNSTSSDTIVIENSGNITTYGDNNIGISAINNGAGLTDITHSGALSTKGLSGHGIYVSGKSGDIIVSSTGTINAQGNDSLGIYAISSGGSAAVVASGMISSTFGAIQTNASGSGKSANVDYTGENNLSIVDITTSGDYAHGIFAKGSNGANANITVRNANIYMNGKSTGILGDIYGGDNSGVTVDIIDTNINGFATNGDGVTARAFNNSQNANIDVTIVGGEINLLTADNGENSALESNYGIFTHIETGSTGTINVNNSSRISLGYDGISSSSSAAIRSINAEGDTIIINSGNLILHGNNNLGMRITTPGTGNIQITNSGGVFTNGLNAKGIDANASNGQIIIGNSGNITTNGSGAEGIYADSAGNIMIENSGDISTNGVSSHGLYAQGNNGANVAVTVVDANILTAGDDSFGIVIKGGDSTNVNATYQVDLINSHINGAGILNSGILVANVAAGSIAITTDANSSITSANAHGIYIDGRTTVTTGDIVIKNAAQIITGTTASGEHGIYIQNSAGNSINSSGQAQALVTNSGHISTNKLASHGIYITGEGVVTGFATNPGAIYGVNITGGDILTQGNSSYGIRISNVLESISGNGDGVKIDVLTAAGSTITTEGLDSHGIRIGGAVTPTNVAINVNSGGNITTLNNKSHGISIESGNGVAVVNSGQIITEGRFSNGINIVNVAEGDIDVITTAGSSITTEGAGGIMVDGTNITTGDIFINNAGSITSLVDPANYTLPITERVTAISVNTFNAKNVHIVNTGGIKTSGRSADFGNMGINVGIAGYSTTDKVANITIENSGNIETYGAHGIAADSTTGTVHITNSANIFTEAPIGSTFGITGTVFAHGIQAASESNDVVIEHSRGILKVVSDSSNASNAGIIGLQYTVNDPNNITVSVKDDGVVDASLGMRGIDVRTSGTGRITIEAGSKVTGGFGSAINLITYGKSGNFTINNAGTIDSSNDHLLSVIRGAGINSGTSITGVPTPAGNATIALNNTGTMTGAINAIDSAVALINLDNSGTWNFRYTYQAAPLTYGNYTKDTQGVAISHFGGGTINHIGVLNLAGLNSALAIDSSNEFMVAGALMMANGGAQGQLLNVSDFNHSGVINLTGNGTSLGGNTLIISGGDALGVNGGGIFTANGGSVRFNTVLNTGDIESQSDMLLVDNVVLGNSPTSLLISIVPGSVGGKTVNNGIKLIDVLGIQNDSAFVLGEAVTYGMYEYILTMPEEGGFYLRNELIPTGPEKPFCRYTSGCGWQNPNTIINPNVGSVLGIQTAGTNMFARSPMGDSMGSSFYADVSQRDLALWATLDGSQTKYRTFNGRLSTKITNAVLNIGSDLVMNEEGSVVLGAYIGLGQSEITTVSRQTGTRSKAESNGMAIGAYFLLNPLKNEGFYLDSWAYYAHFNNKLKGTSAYGGNNKFKSNLFSVTAEVGYKLPVLRSENLMWGVQPKIGVTYNKYQGNSFIDTTHTVYSGNKAQGLQTMVGLRVYSDLLEGDTGIKPFSEINWLHNVEKNRLNVNNENIHQRIGQNVFEVNIGLHGQVTKNLSVFGHIGGQKGSGKFNKLQGQIGIRYAF